MSLERLRLLVLDVDGVLTDGRLYYGADGESLKAFDVRDGAGLVMLASAGVEVAVLSGRESPALLSRTADLGLRHVVTGAGEKGSALRALAGSAGVGLDEIGYVGDDLPDLPAMRLAGWSACPADAAREVRERADFVASAPGGRGAVREVAEHLLRERGQWDAAVGKFAGEP